MLLNTVKKQITYLSAASFLSRSYIRLKEGRILTWTLQHYILCGYLYWPVYIVTMTCKVWTTWRRLETLTIRIPKLVVTNLCDGHGWHLAKWALTSYLSTTLLVTLIAAANVVNNPVNSKAWVNYRIEWRPHTDRSRGMWITCKPLWISELSTAIRELCTGDSLSLVL